MQSLAAILSILTSIGSGSIPIKVHLAGAVQGGRDVGRLIVKTADREPILALKI